MKNILVSGGTGFIGQNLVQKLVDNGQHVTVIVRPNSDISLLGDLRKKIELAVYDGTYSSLDNCFRKKHFECIFHLATCFIAKHEPRDIDEMIESNISFGVKLAEAATRNGVKKFINTASNWQFYHSEDYRPLNLYAAMKQAFEDTLVYYADTQQLRVASVILFDTYSENDSRKKLIPLLLRQKSGESPVKLSAGEQVMDLTHVNEIAEALLRAQGLLVPSAPPYQRYIASSGRALPLKQVIQQLCKDHKLTPEIDWGSVPYREREVFEVKIYKKFANLLRLAEDE